MDDDHDKVDEDIEVVADDDINEIAHVVDINDEVARTNEVDHHINDQTPMTVQNQIPHDTMIANDMLKMLVLQNDDTHQILIRVTKPGVEDEDKKFEI